MRVSKRRLAAYLFLFFALTIAVISHKYIWLYVTRTRDPAPARADLIHGPRSSQDPEILLKEANRLAWLFNWPKAEPLYIRAEQLFKDKGDTRNEVYSRVGRIRAQSETMSWVDVSEILGRELDLPIAKSDKKLRLWCLAAKGYTDLEINPVSAKRVWTEAQGIAHALGEPQWGSRAEGELGFVAFLEGDSRHAAIMVGDAFLAAKASGDTGNQVRLLEMMGNGFNEAKRYGEALAFFERAIKTSSSNPDAGFPFMAYEGESQALAAQGKMPEAVGKLNRALIIARANQKRGHEAMILLSLGELALQSGDRQGAMNSLEQAGQIAQRYNFYRTESQAMIDVAGLYRDAGDLKSAEERATLGVQASKGVGDEYYGPRDLTILADFKAERRSTAEAEALYQNAEDVIDGMLVNLHEAYWSSSLAGAMSATYLQHFELEARQGNLDRALRVLERVRGRTAAALLENRVLFSKDESGDVRALEDEVSNLQLRLMRSENPKERASLLDQLVEYERRMEWTRTERTETKSKWFDTPAPLRAIQSSLRPEEVVLEYVLSEPRSYCVWISRARGGVVVLSQGRHKIEDLTQKYLNATRARREDVDSARQLYDVLFGQLPPEANGEQTIVVPDGILHLLPLDTLRDPAGALLLQTRTISYVPAATVLQVLRNEKATIRAQHSFLGVGDVPYQNQGHVSAKLEKPTGFSGRIERGLSDVFGTEL